MVINSGSFFLGGETEENSGGERGNRIDERLGLSI